MSACVHYGLAEEDILRSGHATVHVRRAIP